MVNAIFQFTRQPYGPLSEYLDKVPYHMKKNLMYLAESYVFNVYQDMDVVKSLARERNITTPPMIIFSFDVPRYTEAAEFVELSDCPAAVANIFMDYCVRNFPFNIQFTFYDMLFTVPNMQHILPKSKRTKKICCSISS